MSGDFFILGAQVIKCLDCRFGFSLDLAQKGQLALVGAAIGKDDGTQDSRFFGEAGVQILFVFFTIYLKVKYVADSLLAVPRGHGPDHSPDMADSAPASGLAALPAPPLYALPECRVHFIKPLQQLQNFRRYLMILAQLLQHAFTQLPCLNPT